MTRRRPTAHKLASGTFRPERDRSLQPIAADVLPPSWLTEAALRIWRAKAPGLVERGLLGQLDVENFAVWCTLQTIVEQCCREGRAPPRDTWQPYRALSEAFALNPDARSKLGMEVDQRPEPENPFAEFT